MRKPLGSQSLALRFAHLAIVIWLGRIEQNRVRKNSPPEVFQLANPKTKSIYSVHPGVVMVQKWVETLPEKTGRSLEEWISLVKKSGPKTEKERREWLKDKHKLGTNSAWW